MQSITVYTLFDITETGVVRSFRMDNLPFTTKSGVIILGELLKRPHIMSPLGSLTMLSENINLVMPLLQPV
mgnify:CR=1 FL=1